jgi:hypothetical protein
MSSTDIPPSLELSDIMHHMSPSPVPPEDPGSITPTTTIQQSIIAEERAESPDMPSETDVLGFRRRLEEMGFWTSKRHNGLQENAISDGKVSNTNSRERELLDMVSVATSYARNTVLTGYLGFAAHRPATSGSHTAGETGGYYRGPEGPA